MRGKEKIPMANYHLEVKNISRGKGHSIVKSVNYISGEKIRDDYNDKAYYNTREDVLYTRIFLPDNAPSKFYQLQNLCTEIDKAEKRYDARTAREFIGSLPNELPVSEQKLIIEEYIKSNFVEHGLCAIAAIHEGRNKSEPEKNNPHVHIIVPTRTVTSEGFSKKKEREWNSKKYIAIWREQWAQVQNRAYERNGYDIHVSHESLEAQGEKDREPTIHISRIDYQKEMRGQSTIAGDKKRAIRERNMEHARQHQIELEQIHSYELSR